LIELGARRSGSAEPTIADRASVYGELRWIAQDRGYATGWASHKFKEKFGVWPNDPRIRNVRAIPPSLKTKDWLVSRQIAFAKARGRVAHG
jgi:DNA repair protein RadD